MEEALKRSRWNFLRLRFGATAVGILVLLVGMLPWLLLAVASVATGGGVRLFALAVCIVLGILLLPVLWLGTAVLRLAWRPLAVWAPVRSRLR